MFTLTFATEAYEDCENPWLCFYRKWKEVLKSSIEKMTKTNLEEVFKKPEVQKDFNQAVEKISEMRDLYKDKIERIVKKSVNMCPPKQSFKVFFLPMPFDYVIMTNYSPEIGTFILYGIGHGYSAENFNIFLPHEYAHVVRLQEILLPEGKDSPYKMTLGEMGILEGLGVAFSMVFNNDLNSEKIPEYTGLKESKALNWKRIVHDFWERRNRNFDELSMDELQRYYGDGREVYLAGSYIILQLISQGFSICSLDKMSDEKIMNLAEDIFHIPKI